MSSATRPFQCLSCRLRTALHTQTRRSFHTSPITRALSELDAPYFKPYTEREKQLLRLKYTPEQMKVIEAGEEAVSVKHMARGRMRTDPMRIKYLDDFSKERPVLDRDLTIDEESRARRERERFRDAATVEETDVHMLRLCRQTGLTERQIKNLRVKCLVTHRVVNQTRMGKIQSLYFLTIAGDGNGMLGIGEGKAAEDEDGRRQAMMNAVRNMQPIERYEDRTIYGAVEAKVGASIVHLSSRPPGFGNRCQHLIFEMARAAGIADLSARTPRSRNKMNVVKAAFAALRSQKLPEDVARGRGRKLVDVRKVYYGGQVY